MPTYRTPHGFVHIKMTNTKKRPAPAPCCGRIQLGGGTHRCMAISSLLCDWELEDGRTCDAPMCPEHANEVGPNKHLCGLHFAMHGAGAV